MNCVWCRAKWIAPAGAGAAQARAGGAQFSEGYLNLSTAAGVSAVRDTSSCAYAAAQRILTVMGGMLTLSL